MINSILINGAGLEPCEVLATVTILHGRGSFDEGPRASSATFTVLHPEGSMPAWTSGDTVSIQAEASTISMFAGRIVERSLDHYTDPDGVVWGQFTVTAAGSLAALGVRVIGSTPWPQESDAARADHILNAAGVPYSVQGTADLNVLARDVDAQPALGLLETLAGDTGAAVFDKPNGEAVYQTVAARGVVPYRWQDFPATFTWDDFDDDLTWDGDPPSLGQWTSPIPAALVLPCSAVHWEPAWRSAEGAVVNHLRVGYGTANPQATVEREQLGSIARHGRRYVYRGTQLAAAADANKRADRIIAGQSYDRWNLDEVVVALDLLDPATYTAVLLLTCGKPVLIQGMPQPAPLSAPGDDWQGIVEGWTYNMWGQAGQLFEQMTLAVSDPMYSLGVAA